MKLLKFGLIKGLSIIALSLTLLACGGSQGKTTTVLSKLPVVSVSAGSTLIEYNTSTTINWTSSNSDTCTSSSGKGGTGTAGTFNTGALTTTTTYTVSCTGFGGTASQNTIINVAPSYAAPTSITAAASAWAAEPMRGTVYYYCDCGTGAESDCVVGNNANNGTSPDTPKRTIENAVARFSSLAINDTVALCKGGAFNSTGSLEIGSNKCGAGIACNDLREYTPTTFTGTSKPIINNAAGNSSLFKFWSGVGGVRLLNIKLKGDGGSSGNIGFYFYGGAHDVTMGNIDLTDFIIGIYNESNAGNNRNIKLTGSYIANNHSFGYLGSGDNDDISYNYWLNNGSSDVGDHTIYFASKSEVKNVRLVGNYVKGQFGPTCYGAPLEAHMSVDGLLVKNNVVDIAASATTGGCWGIEFNNITDDPSPIYHRNAVFSGNTIINGGNLALTVTGCPDCVIENNLIIHETSMEARGIQVASEPARTGGQGDLVNTRNIIRNNSIWFGPNASNGGTGIEVGTEGTGHIIANNTITYSGSSTGSSGPFSCFNYPLSLASYAFINNNHCQSTAASVWVTNRGDLATWKAITSQFDTASFTGNPMFKAAGTDFTPAVGSPLIGAGNLANGSLSDFSGKTRHNPPAIGAYEP